jgi:transcriptional regulator with XRE-family HTH domain
MLYTSTLLSERTIILLSTGESLRRLREKLGLTMRDVAASSDRIAEKYRNDEFSIPPSRLSDMETKGLTPSIYRIYTLSIIYRRDVNELLAWYGVKPKNRVTDSNLFSAPRARLSNVMASAPGVQVPLHMDPAFDSRRTSNLGRMVEQWGLVPLSYLSQFATSNFTYGYVGSQDFTMYPLLRPGTFIQVDELRNKVLEGTWGSEYERPIYFVDTRDGPTCCWCSIHRDEIILQPHPLSPLHVRVLRHPQDAEVLGQVVGVAMRLTDRTAPEAVPSPKA